MIVWLHKTHRNKDKHTMYNSCHYRGSDTENDTNLHTWRGISDYRRVALRFCRKFSIYNAKENLTEDIFSYSSSI